MRMAENVKGRERELALVNLSLIFRFLFFLSFNIISNFFTCKEREDGVEDMKKNKGKEEKREGNGYISVIINRKVSNITKIVLS